MPQKWEMAVFVTSPLGSGIQFYYEDGNELVEKDDPDAAISELLAARWEPNGVTVLVTNDGKIAMPDGDRLQATMAISTAYVFKRLAEQEEE